MPHPQNTYKAYGELKDVVHTEVVKEKNRIEGALGRKGEEKVIEFTENLEPPVNPPQQVLGNCPKCGAPEKMSKAGKPYCSKTCWLK